MSRIIHPKAHLAISMFAKCNVWTYTNYSIFQFFNDLSVQIQAITLFQNFHIINSTFSINYTDPLFVFFAKPHSSYNDSYSHVPQTPRSDLQEVQGASQRSRDIHQPSQRSSNQTRTVSLVSTQHQILPLRDSRSRRHDCPQSAGLCLQSADSETKYSKSITNFADFGFQTRPGRLNNGDSVSKVGVLGCEETKQLQDPSVGLKARFPGVFDITYHQPQGQEGPASESTTTTTMNSASSGLTGSTMTPSIPSSASRGVS